MQKRIACRSFRIVSLVIAISAFPASGQESAAAHVVAPDQYSLLAENEHVLVLKMVLQPGESDVMHSHHNEIVYFQKGGQLTITLPNGESVQADVPDGHVMLHEAWTHTVANSGSGEVIAIIIEDKP